MIPPLSPKLHKGQAGLSFPSLHVVEKLTEAGRIGVLGGSGEYGVSTSVETFAHVSQLLRRTVLLLHGCNAFRCGPWSCYL